MDPYLLVIKYIFKKNNKENKDTSLDEFFSNGFSFPQLISILFEIDQIPGVSTSKNKFQIANNNAKALSYLGQKNPFFSSYSINFNDLKNQQSLIQLILNKVYFKVNRPSFLKKANDFLQPFNLKISNFSEFIQGNGFMKILNVISNGLIPPEIKVNNNDELISQLTHHFNSFNITTIIDKSSLMPSNQDFLIYQALILIDQFGNTIPQSNEIPNNELPPKIAEETKVVKTSSNVKVVCFDKNLNESSIELSKKNCSDDIIESQKNHANDSSEISSDQNEKINNDNPIQLGEIRNNSNSSMSSSVFESSDILNLPKSSYLNIVNNYLEAHKKKGVLYFSDFEQGIILPTLVELLLNEKIPNILEDPIGYDQLMNNMNSLYFIREKDPLFNPRDFNISKQDDVINLIRILFRKYILTEKNKSQMINDCNAILHQYKQETSNFNKDWSDGKYFIALLSFLSKGAIVFPPNEKLDINTLKELFVKSSCISVIEDDSIFENIDEFVIEYQVRLILDEIITRKIEIPKYDKIINNKNDSKIENKDDVSNKNDNNVENKDDVSNKNDKNVENKETLDKDKYMYVKESSPIIRVLNVIGQKIGLHYNTLEDIIDGMTLPNLVAYLMNVLKIPDINPNKLFKKKNLFTTMEYLEEKSEIFKQKKFDFDDKNVSINLFAITLLNQFFFKESKERLIAKASKLLDKKIYIKDLKKIFLFGHGFYEILGCNDVEIKNYYDEKTLLDSFEKVNIPFILDEDSLTNINEDYIFYQLQLIFETIAVELETNQEPIKTQEKYEEEEEDNDNDDDDDDNDNDNDDDGKLFKLNFKEFEKVLNKKNETKSFHFDISKVIEDKMNVSMLNKQENEKKNVSVDDLVQKIKMKKEENNKEQNDSLNQDSAINNDKESLNDDDQISNCLYLPKIDNYSEIKSQIDTTLNQLFKSVYDEINENELENINKSFTLDKTLKVFQLFEYKSGKWIYNKFMFPEFLKQNKIEMKDILYLVLLPPSPIIENDDQNNLVYQLMKAMTKSQSIETKIQYNSYVEIGFGGSINDLRNRFGTHSVPCQNEYFAFMQLKYLSSMKNDPAIINMQTILTLHADYILTLYPNMNIEESVYYINTSLFTAKKSQYFESNSIELSQLLVNFPFLIHSNSDKKINDRVFSQKLDDLINSDKDNIFNEIRNYYKYSNAKIQWIDINNYETYTYFLETMINSCQRKTSFRNEANQYISFLQKVCNINSITNENDMTNLIDDIMMSYNNKPDNILYNYDYEKNEIKFNSETWENFLKLNNINMNSDELFIILFIYSDPHDMNSISKMLTKHSINDSNNSNEILAQIKYCGLLNEIGQQYEVNMKENLKKEKKHLAFISIKAPEEKDIDYFLQFSTAINLLCDIIITISNDKNTEKQLLYYTKLSNLYDLYDYKNYSDSLTFSKLRLLECMIKPIHSGENLFLYQSRINDQELIGTIKEELKETNNCILFHQKNDSCTNFITIIFNILSKSKKISNKLNKIKDMNSNIMDLFLIKILQDFRLFYFSLNDHHPTGFIISEEDKFKTVKRVSNFFIEYEKPFSLALINKYFLLYYLPFVIERKIFNIRSIIDLKQKIIIEYTNYAASSVIDHNTNFDMTFEIFRNSFNKFVFDRVTNINESQIDFFKKYIKFIIYDNFYSFVKKMVLEDDTISNDLIKIITDIVIDKLNDKIQVVLNEIDINYNKTKEYNTKKVVLNEEQIKQNSMKYVLSVRESIRELTVEIECNDDLQKNIPLDC